MNKLKRLLGCGLAAAMILSVAACEDAAPAGTSGAPTGDQNAPSTSGTTATSTTIDPNENAATDKEEKDLNTGDFTPSGNAGEVHYLGYYDIHTDQKTDEQVLIFESETYGGDIIYENTSSGSAYFDKLGTLIASGDSPDLLTFEPLAFPYGVSKNMFEPLDDYFNPDDAIWTDMRDLIDEYQYDGKHYYFPHRMLVKYALNYNRKTIENAGLRDPYDYCVAGEWTWDAWREMMIEFCNLSDENIGFYSTDTMLECFINTTGTSIVNVLPDGTIQNNLADPNITRAIEYLAEMGRNGLLYPMSHPHGDWIDPTAWAKSYSDKILFLGLEPEWTYEAAAKAVQDQPGVENDILNTPSDFAFVPYPKDPNTDEHYICANSYGFMIPRGADNIDGAVEFIYCNRLYETDENIINQVKKDHVDPEKITYTAGDYAGMQRWVIVWDEQVYDFWMDMLDDTKYTFVIEDMYGFSDDFSTPICKGIYGSTFEEQSWTQTREEIMPTIEGLLQEYM